MRKTLALIMVLTGCASSMDNLQRASAESIGRNVLPEAIRISDVQRGITDVRWTATLPSGPTYVCSADDMVRHSRCAKR